MSETAITNPLLLAASKLACRLWRQNVGRGWTGDMERGPKHVMLGPGDVVIRKARPLHAGLCVGSGDTIGLTPVVITPEMVGQTVAVFTSIEIKYGKTRTTPEQIAWDRMVRANGGLSGIVRSVEEGVAVLMSRPWAKREPPAV